MSFGVLTTGFSKKTLADIKAEIEQDQLDTISATLNQQSGSVFGQLNGIFSDKIREMWDVAEAVYRAMYPDSASGDSLDNVSSITGALRLAATPSAVTLDQLFLNNGVTVPVGSVVSVGSTGPRFVTTEAVTNSLGYPATFSAAAESEDNGPIVGLAKTIDTIQTPIAGWSAAAAITCANSETYALDGKDLKVKVDRGSEQTINFSGGDPWSAATAATEIENQTTGVDAYDAGGKIRAASLTEGTGSAIEFTGGTANAVLGFDTAEVKGFNAADAVPGRNTETDADFRLRREQLLRITGAATVEAIRAAILDVDDVTHCTVFENVDIITDPVTGLPPKSFSAIVLGGDEQEIADTIWEVKAAGIETYGSISKTVTDSQGFSHTIEFSRPTPVPIYMELTVLTDPAVFPADGVDQIKAALVAEGATLEVGDDVIALQFKCVPLDVAGVIDVTVFLIDDVDPPVGSVNITIAATDIATFSSTDIDVTVTP